jgi:hypothetical protein
LAAAASPLVRVSGTLARDHATIAGTVRWNLDGIDAGMTVGDVRAVVVDARTFVPTLLGSERQDLSQGGIERKVGPFELSAGQRAAIGDNDRVVLTATQHEAVPEPPYAAAIDNAFVAVDALRAGPARGRVGSADCSDRAIGTFDPSVKVLDYCDLEGAVLEGVDLTQLAMHMTDLSGADMRYAGLTSTILDASRLGGVDMSGAAMQQTFLRTVAAPKLVIRGSEVNGANLLSAVLDGADFSRTTFNDTSFAFARINDKANLSRTVLLHDDFAYSQLRGADFSPSQGDGTSFFFADATDATFKGATYGETEEHESPFRWMILCRTVVPDGSVNTRDCRRPA